LLNRIGCFILIVAAALVALFFATDLAGATDPEYLFYGAVLGLFGLVLWRANRRPSTPSGRFRLLRKLRGKEEDGE
jgi:hypothetical protein